MAITIEQYVDRLVMGRLANIVANSKSDHVSKEDVVKGVSDIIKEYNEATGKNIT